MQYDHVMRRCQRIEQAARAAVDATPNKRRAALEALRIELDTKLPEGHTPQIDRDSVLSRLKAGESQSSIALDLDVHRSSIHKIAKSAGLLTPK